MKKGMLILLLMLSFAFSLSATDKSEATLKINAYKTGSISEEEYLVIKIFDAVTGSLTSLENGAVIDIDDELSTTDTSNKLLGDTSATTSGRLMFVAHVEGNMKGSFSVTVEMSPLAYTDNGKFDLDKRIPFYFNRMNTLCYFKDTNAKTSGTFTIAESLDSTSRALVDTKDNASLKYNWNVTTTGSGSIISDDVWVYRGGVGMVISKDDYTKAPNGKYTTTVKVTVGVES